MTVCNQSSFAFEALGKREIVARFDGGTISSDGGAFLLRQTDQVLLLPEDTSFQSVPDDRTPSSKSPLFMDERSNVTIGLEVEVENMKTADDTAGA